MSMYERAELDEMVARWLEANRRCEETGDWEPLADFYTEDATYGWNYGPDTDFMAVGRDEIRSFALGTEMAGLAGWSYPYEELLVDDKKGHAVGFWHQIADATRADGSHYEVRGIGGSWFRYGGDFQWCWQRDWFDLGNVGALFAEMMTDGTLTPAMQERINGAQAGPLPGCYPTGSLPVGLWDRGPSQS